MSTFAIKIVFCACRKYLMSWFSPYSVLFVLYMCVVRLGMAPSGVWEVWFSAGWETVFLTHCWDFEYRWAGSFRSRGLCKVSFLFCHPPLPNMPDTPTTHPPVECTIFLLFNSSCQISVVLKVPITPKRFFRLIKSSYRAGRNAGKNFEFGWNPHFLWIFKVGFVKDATEHTGEWA